MSTSLRYLSSNRRLILDATRTPCHAAVSLEFVRWRMHRGVPRPLHKLEKKLEMKFHVEQEHEQDWRNEMHSKYRSQMKAITLDIKNDMAEWLSADKEKHIKINQELEMKDWAEKHRINDLWNQESARRRKEREDEERRVAEFRKYDRLAADVRRREIRRGMAKTFLDEYDSLITPENLDDRITAALDEQVFHGRPLDEQGQPDHINVDHLYSAIPDEQNRERKREGSQQKAAYDDDYDFDDYDDEDMVSDSETGRDSDHKDIVSPGERLATEEDIGVINLDSEHKGIVRPEDRLATEEDIGVINLDEMMNKQTNKGEQTNEHDDNK